MSSSRSAHGFAPQSAISTIRDGSEQARNGAQLARQAAEAGQGSQFSTEMVLALGAIFCTVVGYFGLQPLLAAARAGQGAWSFGQLHAVSFALFGLKLALVLALAWRAQRGAPFSPTAPSS